MTREQLEQQYLVKNEMTFTPRYEYKQIEVINEYGKTILIDDYTITATAEEVYQEWQAQQNQLSIIDMTFEEQLLLKQAEQEEVLQTILLDVAILKGGTTDV